MINWEFIRDLFINLKLNIINDEKFLQRRIISSNPDLNKRSGNIFLRNLGNNNGNGNGHNIGNNNGNNNGGNNGSDNGN